MRRTRRAGITIFLPKTARCGLVQVAKTERTGNCEGLPVAISRLQQTISNNGFPTLARRMDLTGVLQFGKLSATKPLQTESRFHPSSAPASGSRMRYCNARPDSRSNLCPMGCRPLSPYLRLVQFRRDSFELLSNCNYQLRQNGNSRRSEYSTD